MPKEPTRPDLTARYEALGYTNRTEFEAKHGLPQNMIGKMKMGWYNSKSSEPSLTRFEEALASEEDSQKRFGCWAQPLPGSASPPAQGRPTKRDSLDPDDAALLEELVAALETSKDIHEVDSCNKKVTVALLRGIVTDATARVLKELISERRQSLNERMKQEEKARGADVLKVEIYNKADWSVPGTCPYCLGAGVLK